MPYNDDMTVGEAIEAEKKSRIIGKKKKKKKPKKDWKSRAVDIAVEMIPGGKKIEEALKKRTKGKSMREKHYPKRRTK
jgi:hypothetical protein